MTRRHAVYLGLLALAAVAVVVFHNRSGGRGSFTGELGPVQIAQAAILVIAFVVMFTSLLRIGGPGKPGGPIAVGLAFLTFFLAWREIEIDDHLHGIHAFSWKYLFEGDLPLGITLMYAVPSLALFAYVVYVGLRHRDAIWLELFSKWPGRLRLMLFGALGVLAVSQLWDKGRSLADRFGIAAFEHGKIRDPLAEELLELCGELLILFFVIEYTLWRFGPEKPATH